MPTLRDPAVPTKEAIFHAYPRHVGEYGAKSSVAACGRRATGWWNGKTGAARTADLELYDYEADPLETKNLATMQPEVIAQLRAILATQPEAKSQFRAGAGRKQIKMDE